MKNLKNGLIVAFLIALAILFFLQHQQQEKLRADNAALAQQFAQMQTDNESLSNRLAAAGDANSLSDKEHNELLKLRGEVGVLRRQTNELGKLQEENQQLQAGRTAAQISQTTQPQDALPQDISKESLTFAGYATPVAGLQSTFWAANQGDLKIFFSSITPETQNRIMDELKKEGDVNDSAWMRQQLANVTGSMDALHITGETVISGSEIMIDFDAGGKNQHAEMIKIGNDWKFARP
jgi:hypothetical protein